VYFYSRTSMTMPAGVSTPIGNWNLAGYQQVNVHAWVKGGSGTSYLQLAFDHLQAAGEPLTIGPPGPGGWNVAILAKPFPVFAPTLSAVLNNSSPSQLDFELRLYAACCEPPPGIVSMVASGLMKLAGRQRSAGDGETHRTLGRSVDMGSLLETPQQAPTESD